MSQIQLATSLLTLGVPDRSLWHRLFQTCLTSAPRLIDRGVADEYPFTNERTIGVIRQTVVLLRAPTIRAFLLLSECPVLLSHQTQPF